MKTDKELLQLFLDSRSDRAFRTLVDRHIDWVYSVALRQVGGDLHLAKDVCQEVFASLAKKAKFLIEYDALNGWLFKAARFAASDMVRSERRRRSREEEASAMEVLESDGDGVLNWALAGPVLDEAIAELDGGDRDALCLRFFEERRFAQIGESLGLNENAARMRVNRALNKLQVVLEKRGVRSTAAVLGSVCAGHALVSAPVGLLAGIVSRTSFGTAAGLGFLGTGKVLLYAGAVATLVGVGAWFYLGVDDPPEDRPIIEEPLVKGGQTAKIDVSEVPAIIESVFRKEVLREEHDSTVPAGIDDEKSDSNHSFITAEDGVAIVSLMSLPIAGTHGTRVLDIRGGAYYKDASPIVFDEEQAEEIETMLTNILSSVQLSDLENRNIKDDLRIVVEDEISKTLGTEKDVSFHFLNLVVR